MQKSYIGLTARKRKKRFKRAILKAYRQLLLVKRRTAYRLKFKSYKCSSRAEYLVNNPICANGHTLSLYKIFKYVVIFLIQYNWKYVIFFTKETYFLKAIILFNTTAFL